MLTYYVMPDNKLVKIKKPLTINLKTRREQLGLTQQKAAARLKVPYRTYCGWEQGHSEPSSDMLILICEVFMIDDLYLFLKKKI